jgi:hypothetical protein
MRDDRVINAIIVILLPCRGDNKHTDSGDQGQEVS